jgi:nicotinamide-nucleotide amidase
MASGVRVRLRADIGLATTGVAGPDPQDGHPPGEVWIAVATAAGIRSVRLERGGDRATIRRETVEAVIELTLASLLE